jgi:putative Holliday junction resolvase
MRLLAVDHGTRRMGIAVADTETGIAFARPALRGREQARAVAALARAEGAQRIIVGLPLNMDGSEGSQAAAARNFGEQLAAIGLEVVYVDERLSSFEAGERLAAAGRRPNRGSGELDSAAATVILQQYLDTEESK